MGFVRVRVRVGDRVRVRAAVDPGQVVHHCVVVSGEVHVHLVRDRVRVCLTQSGP